MVLGDPRSENMNKDIRVDIPEAINEDGVTFYSICMSSDGEVTWSFRRRYKDFFELHENLVSLEFVEKEALPPKKFIGSKDPAFILKRRRELESYIRFLLKKENFSSIFLPQSLIEFLELSLYESDYILNELASSRVFTEVDSDSCEKWSPLHMYAISHRLKTSSSSEDSSKADFAHLADYIDKLPTLCLKGSDDPHGSSNIIPNTLPFDFLAFRSLVSLRLEKIDIQNLESLGVLKDTLVELSLSYCPSLTSIGGILLCKDSVQEKDESVLRSDSLRWKKLEKLDLRYNAISEIDLSLSTAPHLNTLILSHNCLSVLQNLTCLPHLDLLDLSFNNIQCVADLHAKLGQIRQINLSGNQIITLNGFSRLFSLLHLSVNGNKIRELESVTCVSSLPCLEYLSLQGNPVTNIVDYRLKVLESFGKRCPEITLDNELASQQEVDKVSVLMALRVAREGKSPTSLFGNLPRKV